MEQKETSETTSKEELSCTKQLSESDLQPLTINGKHLVIAIPSKGQINTETVQSIQEMVMECFRRGNKLNFLYATGTLLAHLRSQLIDRFLDKTNADYFMFLDSDMSTDAINITKMMQHLEDGKDIICGIARTRTSQRTLNVYLKSPDPDNMGEYRYKAIEGFARDGLVQVDATGCACIMFRREALEKLRDKVIDAQKELRSHKTDNPVFECIKTALKTNTYTINCIGHRSEDMLFCEMLKSIGLEIWCDSNLKFKHEITDIVSP